MKAVRNLVGALALASLGMVSACGGGEKKTEEPAANTDPVTDDSSSESSDPADMADPADAPTSAGDEFDSDPLPNPCSKPGSDPKEDDGN